MTLSGVKPVSRHKTLAEDTFEKLRLAIMTGAVKPGERISARAVAEAAKVSFTPAREAVGRLIAEGALEAIGPKTIVVPSLTEADLRELTTIRKLNEGLAAELAVKNFDEAAIRKLSDTQTKYERIRRRESFQESLKLNEDFHFQIYNRCGMPRLISIIESLWLKMGPSFNLLNTAEDLPERPHSFHRDAIEGLKSGNRAKVGKAIKADIDFGLERLVTLLPDPSKD